MLGTKNDLFGNIKLEGDALNHAIGLLLGQDQHVPYCTDWSYGGPLIEANQIFLDAPHEKHLNFGPGPDGVTRGDWVVEQRWTATVSAKVRTKPNPNMEPGDPLSHLTVVGRGAGPTPLIACMRAIVDSYVHASHCKCGACPLWVGLVTGH